MKKTFEPVGVIGAMEQEVRLLIESMQIESEKEIAGMRFTCGLIEGKQAVVVMCGVGKVNAAICAHTLIREFGARSVINTGAAGSLNNEINISDLVFSTDALQYDLDASPLGFAVGEIPYANVREFPADEELRRVGEEAAAEAFPGTCIFTGRICSADTFVASVEAKERIRREFGGECCEMEGAAIAQACYLNKTPYLIVRAISDKADGSGDADFSEFSAEASRKGAELVRRMIEKM